MIADGKRGDIDVTARAYAQSLFGGLTTPFGDLAGLGADMATVNPLMGATRVEPFVAAARARRRRRAALVRTSNPGAADVEDLRARRRRDRVGAAGGDRATSSGAGRACGERVRLSAMWAPSSEPPSPATSRARAS